MGLTPAQECAASTRGRPLLVAAAAGSGKTHVLVERLMRYVDDGADIDEFLIITFTRAAAAELRSRILSSLNERANRDPMNRRLRRQTELCARAPIGTIDSICGKLLREYVHLTALSPDFRVIEEERSEKMKRAALERVLEERYETIERDENFRALSDSVGAGRDDARLVSLTLELFDSLRAHPHPDEWMDECRAALDVPQGIDLIETAWGKHLLTRAAEKAEYWAKRLEREVQILSDEEHEKLRNAYAPGYLEAAEGLRRFAKACALSWDDACAALPIPMKIKQFRGSDDHKDECKAVWDKCRDAAKKLETDFSVRSEQQLRELKTTKGAMLALLSLTEDFSRAYAADKRRAGLVDFSDQEHMVLELLEKSENGMAAELSGRWREVMVDEYQDVNACQDRLFSLLADGGRKLFLVGDVKQSIYRFRLADPGIFLDKYDRFADVESTPGSEEGGRILLRENFRSSESVIYGCNRVFENILSRSLGEVSYDEGARLSRGREQPGAPFVTELDILDLPESAGDEERADKLMLEARMVARKIHALLDEHISIPTKDGGERELCAGDIAILLRSKKVTPHFRAALLSEGIPSVAQQGGGFFRSLEVSVLLSLLAVIDNPHQDIPLIAVLRSPLYGFTPDELAAIRAENTREDFYTALLSHAEDAHCAAFLAELEDYRALSADLPVSELLGRISARSELLPLLSAMPDGEARRENVQLLFDYARQFEQEGYRGLFAFTAWMKRLAERGDEPRTGEVVRGDAVQIMSIHHSKGLEYPIVFLCNTARKFNPKDVSRTVLIHPKLGLGSKVIDPRLGAEFPSFVWQAIKDRIRLEMLSEELRVLYVALTRARERLYISCAWQKAGKKYDELALGLGAPIEPLLLEGDASFSQWLARCSILAPDAIRARIVPCEAATPLAESAAEETETGDNVPEATPLSCAEKLAWRYPWERAASLPSKLTASALKAGELPDDDLTRPAELPRPAVLPDLGTEERPLTGAERGTAVHLALQFIDLKRVSTPEEIAGELVRLREEGRITPRQAEAIRVRELESFFRSETGRRILRAKRLWRELRFTLLVPAEELDPLCTEDEVLFQGVVDCCVEEADGTLTVIDYKTDYVTEETLAARAESYAGQVRSYARALERILRAPVRAGVLYFLRLGREVTVAL